MQMKRGGALESLLSFFLSLQSAEGKANQDLHKSRQESVDRIPRRMRIISLIQSNTIKKNVSSYHTWIRHFRRTSGGKIAGVLVNTTLRRTCQRSVRVIVLLLTSKKHDRRSRRVRRAEGLARRQGWRTPRNSGAALRAKNGRIHDKFQRHCRRCWSRAVNIRNIVPDDTSQLARRARISSSCARARRAAFSIDRLVKCPRATVCPDDIAIRRVGWYVRGPLAKKRREQG